MSNCDSTERAMERSVTFGAAERGENPVVNRAVLDEYGDREAQDGRKYHTPGGPFLRLRSGDRRGGSAKNGGTLSL